MRCAPNNASLAFQGLGTNDHDYFHAPKTRNVARSSFQWPKDRVLRIRGQAKSPITEPRPVSMVRPTGERRCQCGTEHRTAPCTVYRFRVPAEGVSPRRIGAPVPRAKGALSTRSGGRGSTADPRSTNPYFGGEQAITARMSGQTKAPNLVLFTLT